MKNLDAKHKAFAAIPRYRAKKQPVEFLIVNINEWKSVKGTVKLFIICTKIKNLQIRAVLSRFVFQRSGESKWLISC